MARPSASFFFRCTAPVLLLLISASCKKPAASGPPPPQAPAVDVAKPVQKEIVEWDEYTGRLAAAEFVEIRSRVSGYLESVEFEDGQTVAAGDLLFVIDPRPFEADLARAQATLRQTQAQVTLTRKNFTRSQELRQEGVIAASEFDVATNNLREAEERQREAEAAVTAAKLNLDYARITAPLAGRVSRKNVSEGNLITGGATNATLLTTIVSYDPIYCYFDVDESAFLKYQKVAGKRQSVAEFLASQDHTQVEMALADEEGFPHKGRLTFVDNRLNTETSTIELRATFANPGQTLTPGLFARVRVPATERYKAILIPDQAVQTDQSQTFVYVVGPDEKAIRRPVTLGPLAENLRVVRSGVRAGDRVITSGTQSVRPGQPVRAEEKPVSEIVPGAGGPKADQEKSKAEADVKTKRTQSGEDTPRRRSKKEAEEDEKARRRDEHLNKGTK